MNRKPECESSPEASGCVQPLEPAKEQAATQAVSDLKAQLAEVQVHLDHFLKAHADALRAKLVRTGLAILLVIGVLVAVVSSLVTVVVMLISGMAGGVSELVGNRLWLGRCITAVTLLATTVILLRSRWRRFKAARLRELVNKYEGR